MEVRRVLSLPLILLLASLFTKVSSKSYIVYFGGHPSGTQVSTQDYEHAKEFNNEFLSSFLGNKKKAGDAIFRTYKHINAFAAHLDESEALQISKHPQVISVFPNTLRKLQTTRTWGMLNMGRDGRIPEMSIWNEARLGEGVIIGTLDSGVWPESKSFNDEGMGPVPERWKGFCQNNTREAVPCNKKLIGARYFNDGYLAINGTGEHLDLYSARDFEGHGSHTLSTAGGRLVPGVNFFGSANGTAAGGSPNARVATYKVCYPMGCTDADLLSGFDAAIEDGVDVLSVSIGGGPQDYFTDAIAVGSFHAVMNGIHVFCSASNSGPFSGTVVNTAPWITTVAASTIDREFYAYVQLGNNKRFKGLGIAQDKLSDELYPLIDAKLARFPNATEQHGKLCYEDALDPEKVKGKIVVCLRGDLARELKSLNVLNAGGIGMILVNDKTSTDLVSDPHFLPSSHISYTDGLALYSYLNSTKSPVGNIEPTITEYDKKPTPYVADFSSRGPNVVTPQILKPDITAPGVNVLAAYCPLASLNSLSFDHRHVDYNLLSGTSMSCPHVAGIAGLLKALHPDWSPAMLRSAIMTTARTRDNTVKPMSEYNVFYQNYTKATPFDYGSGHIRPNRAMDPGLVYDTTVDDYLNFLCALGYNSTQMAFFTPKPYACPTDPINLQDLNYPSISVFNMTTTATVTRSVTNVGGPGIYKVHVKDPYGVSVLVEPKTLKFDKLGDVQKFRVTLKVKPDHIEGDYTFGGLLWSDGKHYVRSPISVYVKPKKS